VRFINDYPLDKNIPTLAAMLGKAGYETKSFDVVPFVRSMLDGQGFDSFHDEKVTIAEETVVAAAQEWIEAKRERPFFAFLRLSGAHWPYRAEPGAFGFGDCDGHEHRFNEFSWRLMGVIPSPKRGQGVLLRDAEAYRKFNLELDYDEATLRHIADHYDAEVRQTDAVISSLLDRLRSSGLIERTVIVFTSDHGESLGEHGYLQHGPRVDEPVVRVPLVVRLPEKHRARRPGVKIDGIVRTVDIVPTVLDAVGQPIPDGLDGASLLPAIAGEPLPDLWAYAETGRVYAGVDPEIHVEGVAGKHRMIRQGDWKLIYVPKPGVGEYRLYNLKEDPGEATNVATKNPEVVKKLRVHLESILSTEEDASSRTRELTEAEKEQLRALGYM
jgi:arylsulfatase A-like enzyme